MRTTLASMLLLAAFALTGCVTFDARGPLNPRFNTPRPAEAEAKASAEPAPPAPPVVADQVTPENAHQTAEALRQEMDRAGRE
jgi:hypothetical protein